MSSLSRRNGTVTAVLIVVVVVLIALFSCLFCCGIGAALSTFLFVEQDRIQSELTPSLSDFQPTLSGTARGDLDQALVQRLSDTATNDTSYWVLYGQLRSETGEAIARMPVQGPTDYQVGDAHTFWMSDEEQYRYWQIDAELHIKTEHTYLYVDQGTTFDMDRLSAAAELFESRIYPANRRIFGSEWTPGIDNDPRVTILVTHQMPAGIAGYFSSSDEYPRTMKLHSNEREMVYVTSSYLADLALFGQLLSHEFQHMIHWNQDQSESLWVNEGLSLLAEEINGYKSVLGGPQFWRDSDVQLTNWAEEPEDRYRDYAASKLFLSYLGEHYGGYEIMATLTADDAYGVDGIDNLLRARGYDAGFVDVFTDWVVANLINDSSVDDGRYSYSLLNSSKPKMRATVERGTDYAGWVSQFGTDYLEIDTGAGNRVTFQGSGRVRLTGTDPHGGEFAWWANRRNMLSSSLTREVDLRAVKGATFRFWTWYDIEEHFDYGYVAASTDSGVTWKTLAGTHTTSEEPNKANYGHGYTGKSQVWLEERIDLGAYAGQTILIRFWYISDPGLNQPGWLVDDISIPEIGFFDDGEQENSGWRVDGFARSSNYVPQSYILQLVEYGPQIRIRRIDPDGENRAEFQLGNQTDRATLIVSGVTRWTSEATPYRIEVK